MDSLDQLQKELYALDAYQNMIDIACFDKHGCPTHVLSDVIPPEAYDLEFVGFAHKAYTMFLGCKWNLDQMNAVKLQHEINISSIYS